MRKYYNQYYFNKKFQKKDIFILKDTNINIKQNLSKDYRKLNYKKFKFYYIKRKWAVTIYKLNFFKSIKIYFIFYINALK